MKILFALSTLALLVAGCSSTPTLVENTQPTLVAENSVEVENTTYGIQKYSDGRCYYSKKPTGSAEWAKTVDLPDFMYNAFDSDITMNRNILQTTLIDEHPKGYILGQMHANKERLRRYLFGIGIANSPEGKIYTGFHDAQEKKIEELKNLEPFDANAYLREYTADQKKGFEGTFAELDKLSKTLSTLLK